MSLPHIILGMLRKEPKSGYDLKKELEMVIHFFWEADTSRIYRSLSEMQKKGWVAFEVVIQEDSPNKKVYSLTDAGRQELRDWLAEPGKTSGTNNAFLAQLHFSDAITVAQQLRVLEVRLAELGMEIKELQRRAASLHMPVPLPADALRQGMIREMFSLEYGIRRYQFEIEWVENTIRILKMAP
ncbi:MAG: PadR family transcriptional regulator [Anaerolineales bacterium]|nr:PadR family transcriptional regulator [Anaerolineales bacterium]MCB8952435.1 PadR family transcriptional regulator [Ardenticatenales bacterium]